MLFGDKKCDNCETYYDATLKECPSCHKSNELYKRNGLSDSLIFFHPFAQIGLFLGGFGYAGMLIIELIAVLLFGNLVGNDDEVYRSAVLLVITYTLMFCGLLAIIIFTKRDLFFSKYKRSLDYIYGVGYAATIILISSLVSIIVSLFYQGGDNLNQETAVTISQNYPLLAFFIIGILGPICEELTYRVGLYSFLRRINKYLAFGITMIVFALIHFSFNADDLVGELWSLPAYVLSGAILTLAYEHRGPACSMTAHVVYNTVAFFMIVMGA